MVVLHLESRNQNHKTQENVWKYVKLYHFKCNFVNILLRNQFVIKRVLQEKLENFMKYEDVVWLPSKQLSIRLKDQRI